MMWNSPRFFAVAVALMVGACGGGQARTQGTQNSPRSQASMRSLPDMLGPFGAHQSPAQLAEIAALIHRFERDPEAPFPENNTERSTLFWFMAWVVESPDVHVIVSPVLGQLGEGRGADIGPMTTPASLLGMAAYLAEHPGVDGHDADVQTAGIVSSLLWYEASLRHGHERNAFLDELLVLRAQGGLREWWVTHVHFNE
jgi:hypothetical protein